MDEPWDLENNYIDGMQLDEDLSVHSSQDSELEDFPDHMQDKFDHITTQQDY